MGRVLIVTGLVGAIAFSVAIGQEGRRPSKGRTAEISDARDVASGLEEVTDASAVDAAEKKPREVKMYPCKYVAVSEAAELLTKLTEGAVNIAVDVRTNTLIATGTKQQLQTVEALLQKLDQAPKRVAFDFTFADLPTQKADSENDASQTSTEYWLKRIRSKEEKDKGNINEVRVTAMDGQKAMVQYGAETPVISGLQQRFPGQRGSTPVVRQTQTGTLIECNPRITADGTIMADMKIERSQLAPEIGAVLEETDDKNTVRTPGTLTTTCHTTLSLKAGVPHVVCGMNSQQGKTGTHSVIVVTAQLLGENE